MQFAHQRGVVHRDLKPENILVERDGHPKILDFGIARLADGGARPMAPRTEKGLVLGTLLYMSPEQLSGDPEVIDSRSDVYALGVLLFELISGAPPHAAVSPAELARRVAEEEVRLPPPWRREWRGDLERIVRAALEPVRERRYQSPGELAADVRRMLRDEPIQVRPTGALYHLARLGRRHRGLVAGLAIGLVALVAGAVAALVGLVRTDRALDEARAIHGFLDDMLASVSPGEMGHDVTVRAVLDATARDVEVAFADRPHVRARLHATLGRSYFNLGRYAEAARHHGAAAALLAGLAGEAHEGTLAARHREAEALLYAGELAPAERTIEATLRRDDLRARGAWLYHEALGLEGLLRQSRGDLAGARERLEAARSGLLRARGSGDAETQTTMNNLAGVLLDAGEPARAETILRELLAARRERYAEDHPRVLGVMSNLAVALRDQGKSAEAVALLRRVNEAGARVFGPEHPRALTARHNLATSLLAVGERDEGLALLRATAQDRARVLGAEHTETLVSLNGVAVALLRSGAFAEAASVLRGVVAAHERAGRETREALVARNNLAAALAETGAEEAVEAAAQALAAAERLLGPGHRETLGTRNNYGCALRDRGELERAREVFARNLELAERHQPGAAANGVHFAFNLGRCLASLGRWSEAEPHLLAAHAAIAGRTDVREPQRYARALAELYEALGRPEQAARFR